LVKPYLALPMLLVFLWSAPSPWRLRALAGFILALLGWIALGILGTGDWDIYGRWWHVLRHFPRAEQAS